MKLSELPPEQYALVALTILIFLPIVIYLVSKGLLKINVKGFSLEKPSVGNEPTKETPPLTRDRELLLEETRFTETFIEYTKSKVLNEMTERNLGNNFLNIILVCEKMHERCLTWIILNHITDTPEYINLKIEESYRAVIAATQQIHPELNENKEFQELMKTLCEEFTKAFINGYLSVKKNKESYYAN